MKTNYWPLLAIFHLAACGDSTTTTTNCTPATTSATYTLNFTSTWSSSNHPTDFPSNAHFSKLVGLTHNSSFTLWTSGGTATDGIEQMAETGATTTLETEISAAISAGTGGVQILDTSTLSSSPGSQEMSFTATNTHTLVSVVTMIAPSPDWFVGISSVDLCENGAWKSSVTQNLDPWDAGTDSGTTYTSADADTTPHEAISKLTGSPFDVSGTVASMGSFTLTKQ